MTASILYPLITIRLQRAPDNFRHIVRSIVRASRNLFVAAIFFSSARKFGKKNLGRRDRLRSKIVEIGAILTIFNPFQVLKIHMPLLGEFSRSSQDSCEADYDSHKSRDDRLNSPKSGGRQKVSGKLFTQKNKIDTAMCQRVNALTRQIDLSRR